jgi:redox-sensing transcriptional repressor
MTSRRVPDIVIGRLPRYLQTLQYMEQAAEITTSSKEISDRTGISAAQIRKDLSHFGEFGKQGKGYQIPFLIEQLQNILKLKNVWQIALIGAGDLGHAIARYNGFANRGFQISHVFDSNPIIIGSTIGNFTVHDISNMHKLISENRIKLAMLTVPAIYAQEVAEKLIAAGVQAILNYAPIILHLPPNVEVQNIDPLIQLQHMTYYLEK